MALPAVDVGRGARALGPDEERRPASLVGVGEHRLWEVAVAEIPRDPPHLQELGQLIGQGAVIEVHPLSLPLGETVQKDTKGQQLHSLPAAEILPSLVSAAVHLTIVPRLGW